MQRLIVLLLLLVLAACTVTPVSDGNQIWDYASLRLIDGVDSPQPDLDLVAAYLRSNDLELEIRLDLLDHAAQPNYDVYLAIDAAPGGSTGLPVAAQPAFAWEYLLSIPAGGNITAVSFDGQTGQSHSIGNLGLRVKRDPELDTIIISLNRRLPALQRSKNPGVQVFLTPARLPIVVDQLAPIQLGGSPPPPAQALLAFWNVLPAYTPAQALRRWDGAHAGPLGGRHGLYNLLKAASKTQMPLALLDLKTPGSLAALEFMGGLEMVQEMAAQELLILPDNSPGLLGDPGSVPNNVHRLAADAQAEIVRNFDLPVQHAVYLPDSLDPLTLEAALDANPHTRLVFARQVVTSDQTLPAGYPTTNSTPVMKIGQTTLVLLPAPDELPEGLQPAPGDGLPVAARVSLANTAAQPPVSGSSSTQVLLLGGSLPGSAWGNPQFAQAALHYLASHPWIKVLNWEDLQTIEPDLVFEPDAEIESLALPTGTLHILDQLASLPDNLASRAAWQAFLALDAPVSPATAELPALRAHYTGQINALAEAARWAEQPVKQADCTGDYDQDGQPECVLANETIFTLFELEQGGFLAYGFFIGDDGELHQFAAPSSQLISGTSSASTWDLARGLLADPSVLPGAFFDSSSDQIPLPTARAALDGDSLVLAYRIPGQERVIQKTVTLLADRLSVQYSATPVGPLSSQMILAIDPWLRLQPGWPSLYHFSASAPGQVVAQAPGVQIEITTDASLNLATFLDTLQVMSRPEDPNQEHPAGHYLPFPLASAGLSAPGDFSVQVILRPSRQ